MEKGVICRCAQGIGHLYIEKVKEQNHADKLQHKCELYGQEHNAHHTLHVVLVHGGLDGHPVSHVDFFTSVDNKISEQGKEAEPADLDHQENYELPENAPLSGCDHRGQARYAGGGNSDKEAVDNTRGRRCFGG